MADVSTIQGRDVVLLADDNDDDVILFKRAYAAAGIDHQLRIVHDGNEVVDYLSGAGKFADRGRYPLPRFLVLDLNMPGRDGFQVLKWVRESAFKSLPIAVLTMSGDLSDAKKAYAAGASTFIEKSQDMQEFVGQLRELKLHWL